MKFEIKEKLITHYQMTYLGEGLEAVDKTAYDLIRVSDHKLIKSFNDLLEALYYKKELEKLIG